MNEIDGSGQKKCYLVLSEEERAKGFVRPLRAQYRHIVCGMKTSMGQAIAETYARNPSFYGATYCATCMNHFRLVLTKEGEDGKLVEERQFEWIVNGQPDGSYVGE